jgi:hypothetical protein
MAKTTLVYVGENHSLYINIRMKTFEKIIHCELRVCDVLFLLIML